MEEIYQGFTGKLKFLEEKGFQVEVMWGCEFQDIQLNDPHYKEYEQEIMKAVVKPLQPRDAFLGEELMHVNCLQKL